jgi:hypothetical protein
MLVTTHQGSHVHMYLVIFSIYNLIYVGYMHFGYLKFRYLQCKYLIRANISCFKVSKYMNLVYVFANVCYYAH